MNRLKALYEDAWFYHLAPHAYIVAASQVLDSIIWIILSLCFLLRLPYTETMSFKAISEIISILERISVIEPFLPFTLYYGPLSVYTDYVLENHRWVTDATFTLMFAFAVARIYLTKLFIKRKHREEEARV